MEKAIIARVKGLFDSRDISQRELADAVGVSPSWVSAFFGGRRPANDIHLLIKIARYFGVTVGYLLNETEKGRDASVTTLQTIWERLNESDRGLLMDFALSLQKRRARPGDEPTGGSSDDPQALTGRNSGAGNGPRKGKRR